MSTLHTVCRVDLLPTCARYLHAGDAVVLLEDGVYLCAQKHNTGILDDAISLYGLADDCLSRGVNIPAACNVKLISYLELVDLCCRHDKILNWF